MYNVDYSFNLSPNKHLLGICSEPHSVLGSVGVIVVTKSVLALPSWGFPVLKGVVRTQNMSYF